MKEEQTTTTGVSRVAQGKVGGQVGRATDGSAVNPCAREREIESQSFDSLSRNHFCTVASEGTARSRFSAMHTLKV